LTLTSSCGVGLTQFLRAADLAADVEQPGDDGVDREVGDAAGRQRELRPTHGARHRPPTRPLGSEVVAEAGGTEGVDGAGQDARVSEDVAADGTLD